MEPGSNPPQIMEKSFEDSANRIMSVEGVKGVCCSSENGDLYCAKGTLDERSAAILAQLTMLAAQIEKPIEPIISLQSEKSRVLIRRYNNLVVGVHKLI